MQPSKVKFNEPGHPNTTLADWNTFQREFSRYSFEKIIDRKAAQLPDWFVPLARGAAIASPYLLRQAGYRPGMGLCPGTETVINPETCCTDGDERTVVRRFGSLWTVECFSEHRATYYEADQVLVHTFGSTVVLTRSCEAASHLANAFRLGGLCWINACPLDQNAVKFAKTRARDEARAESKMAATISKQLARRMTSSAQP